MALQLEMYVFLPSVPNELTNHHSRWMAVSSRSGHEAHNRKTDPATDRRCHGNGPSRRGTGRQPACDAVTALPAKQTAQEARPRPPHSDVAARYRYGAGANEDRSPVGVELWCLPPSVQVRFRGAMLVGDRFRPNLGHTRERRRAVVEHRVPLVHSRTPALRVLEARGNSDRSPLVVGTRTGGTLYHSKVSKPPEGSIIDDSSGDSQFVPGLVRETPWLARARACLALGRTARSKPTLERLLTRRPRRHGRPGGIRQRLDM